MANNTFAAHSVGIGTASTPVEFRASRSSIPANSEIIRDDSGALYDLFVSLGFVAPVPQFTTFSVPAALGQIGVAGDCLRAGTALASIAQYYESKPSCGGDGADHLSWTTSEGYVRPVSLSASRTEDVSLSVEVDALSIDGSADAIVQTSPATLPTAPDASRYALGGVAIAGVDITDALSINLSYGIEMSEKLRALGGQQPVDVALLKFRPELTVEVKDLSYYGTDLPLSGRSAVHSDTTIKFRKRLNRAAFVDDATEEHWSMTLSGVMYYETIADGSGSSQATSTIRLAMAEESAVAPIVYSFDEAYS